MASNDSGANKYKQQYVDHFNKIGKNEKDSQRLISDYEKQTKGLDPEKAFQALDGGRTFDLKGGDKKRYDNLTGERKGQKHVNEMRKSGNLRDNHAALTEHLKGGGYLGQRAQQAYARMGDRISRIDARKAAKEKANGAYVDTQPVQPDQQGQIPPGTKVDSSVHGNFGVGGDLDQNVGKKGDTNTTIGDGNTIGHGATIGGDYSVTIGGNSAGNGQQGAGSGSGTGNVFNNMSNLELAVSYSALNNNAYQRSRAQLNGAGRAAQASASAAEITGATDRVANLYNATGMDQNYWRNKANAQTNQYLGDIFKEGFGGYNWTMPESPNKIEDDTKEIYDDAKDEMKDV